MAAGLCPDPLGELKRSARPPSRNKGAYFLRGGKGGEGNGWVREGVGTCSKVLGGNRCPCVLINSNGGVWKIRAGTCATEQCECNDDGVDE